MNNLTVIVPFFNEELYLEESVNRLLKIKIYDSIILIDNNSSDQSLEIAKNLAQKNKNIYFYQTDETQGKGVALNFSQSLITTTHVAIHDADLEYFPEDIIEMFSLSEKFPDSMILGSRFIGSKDRKNVYKRTYIANKFMSFFFSIVNFYYVSDVATCYKLMPTNFFQNIYIKEQGFSIEIELVSKFLKYNRSVKELPIKYSGRSYKEGKKIKFIDGFKFLFNTLKYRFTN